MIANRVEPDESSRSGGARRPARAVARRSRRARAVGADRSGADRGRATAELVLGSDDWLDREALGFVVAAMSLPNVLARLRPDVTVIAPGDRTDLLPGLMLAHQSGTFPPLAGIVLTGGYEIPETIRRLIDGCRSRICRSC